MNFINKANEHMHWRQHKSPTLGECGKVGREPVNKQAVLPAIRGALYGCTIYSEQLLLKYIAKPLLLVNTT